jgi:hypothetical protein
MTGEPPKGFDTEDWATLREVIEDHRNNKAVKAKFSTWGKALLVASGVLIALSQFRDAINTWLSKGGH